MCCASDSEIMNQCVCEWIREIDQGQIDPNWLAKLAWGSAKHLQSYYE